MKNLSKGIIRFRWAIIFAFAAVALLFGIQVPKAKMNPDMLTYMPENMSSRVNKSRIEDLFGGSEMIIVLVKTDDVLMEDTLRRVKRLSQGMKRIKGVDKVLSLFELKQIKGEEGTMIVDPAVKRIPQTEEDREVLRADIRDNDIVFGNVVSKDFTLTAIIGMVETGIAVNTDPINYYDSDHPVAYSANLINKHLGGFFSISVVFEGDIKNPRVLKKINHIERELMQYPEVGNTQSIARVARQMSRVLNDEDEKGYDSIPDSRQAVAQYFELYTMSGDPEDFEKMVDFPYEHAVVTARINSSSTPVLRRVVERIRDMVADDPDVSFVGGISDVFSDLSVKIVGGQFISLGIALTAVTLLLMFLFRSVNAGLISALPLCLSMVILFGLMGFLHIELNMATALLSSIMIGVGIDYTIHFLWRYREERAAGLPHAQAARRTLLTAGRGIIFNAFSVIVGFAVLMLSSFVPVRFFGFLVVVSILACLIGALVFIPALCLVLKPSFLEPRSTCPVSGIKFNRTLVKKEI